jgi:lipopolysaccharide assembly outer membrane protein LptD (OstA)
MLRSGSSSRRYWALVIAGLLLIVAARGQADEPVICPSSANNLTHASTPVTPAPRIGISAPRIGAGAPFDITSDAATVGAGGDAILQGNVQVLQGDRELRANHAHYDPTDKTLELQGSVEYTDSLMHVTGTGGNYTENEGADFSSAEFELHQPPSHGAADVMHLTADG